MLEQFNEVATWFASGRGRYAAAALLVITMQMIKVAPVFKEWLAKDSGKLFGIGFAWTAKRKKALTTAILALAPVVPLLASDLPIEQVIEAAGEILSEAFGIKMLWNVVRKQPPANDNSKADAA